MVDAVEHTFLDVIEGSNSKKEVRMRIELNFRGQFEMARANEDIRGEDGEAMAVLKIVCGAAIFNLIKHNYYFNPVKLI